MHTAHVAIVGGGLSGVYAASLLEQRGINDYVLLEASDRLGGRIASHAVSSHPALKATNAARNIDRFDLGPTWFWPEFQPQLARLVRDLGLQCVGQHEAGDMVMERSPSASPVRVRGYANSSASMRLLGGMGTLVEALQRGLDPTLMMTGQKVSRLRSVGAHVELDSEDAVGSVTTWRVDHVLLAIPPRLAVQTIVFEPDLPPVLAQQWRATATWMAPHAKYVAIYDVPFWREHGLSGEARSTCGPLNEIHDASVPGGSAALFGFFGIPASVRTRLSGEVLRARCRAQLARLFGPKAGNPKADVIKDWALAPYTATAADQDAAEHHGNAPVSSAATGLWRERLTGIASEWSLAFPGYVAGAVDAASRGVQISPIFATGASTHIASQY